MFLLNGVMVALQILVLSVWVRVLVEQQNETITSGSRFFIVRTPGMIGFFRPLHSISHFLAYFGAAEKFRGFA